MSSTFSELAATALVDALGTQPESDRHLVTSVHGEGLADIFRGVLAQAEDRRVFRAGPTAPPAELRVLDNGDGCIIVPYLVQEPPPAHLRDNRGSQGFASALRDHYADAAAPGERMMLLAFDSSPNETLVTTMNQGVAESALGLPRLFALALRPPEGASQALRRTLAELERIAPRRIDDSLDAETVGRAAQAVGELGIFEGNEKVAAELYRMPWCLSDPELFAHAGPSFTRRLQAAMKYREQLEAWASDPSTDFDAEVRKTFPAAAAKVVEVRIGSTLGWHAFTLGDLLAEGGDREPEEELPQFAALPLTITESTATKLLDDGKTVAAQVPGPGCSLTFHLTSPLSGEATIHLVGYAGTQAPFIPSTAAKITAADGGGTDPGVHIARLPQPRPGWSFMEAVLTKGKRIVKAPLGSVRIAISVSPADSAHAYTADGIVDLEAQAYSGHEQLTFIAERDGVQLLAERLEAPEPEFGDMVSLGEGLSVPAVQADGGDGAADEQPCDSPEHLAIEAWAAGTLPPGEVQTSLRERPGGVVVGDVGPVSLPVGSSSTMPASRWALERHAIENPRTTAFHLSPVGVVTPSEPLEHLALGSLSGPFELFLAAREAFFAELAELRVPSILAADLTASARADAYIGAYEQLLAAIPDHEPGQLGYDRIVLSDSFTTDSGEVLIAPTSPLSVALHLQLQEQVRGWVSGDPGGNYFAGDAGLISAQYLIPYLRLHTVSGQWLESGYAPYPWRRYLPFAQRTHQQRHPFLHRYMARRIERFLDVHPSYGDDRRTIRLAFINPGAAGHVRKALLALVTTFLKRGRDGALHELPALELQLLSDEQSGDALLGADLDVFMGLVSEQGQPSDVALEVMRRLSYTKGSTAEFLQDPKSFAHITFVEDFFQPRGELVEWPSDAHPSSMYVGGLAADTERLATSEPSATRFLSAAWTGATTGGRASRIASRTGEIAASAAGVPVKPRIVRAADVFVPNSQIPQLYDRAVWVVHIDRHVGLELFAPQDASSSAPYILDYTDQETPDPGIFDGITATSQVGPYLARIADVLGEAVSAAVPEAAAERLLRTLNLISGRWGLEMLRTSDNVLRGRLATALAAQVLEQAEGLHADPARLTLVIALDELLRVTGGEGLPLSEGWAAKAGVKGGGSDDLLILGIPLGAGRPQLTGRIVEVKYRSAAGASTESAAEQLKKTHTLLTQLLVNESQPGRSFQGRHLAKLVFRYTSRHVAYGLRSQQPVVAAGTEALSRIAAGDYDLDLDLHRAGKTLCGDYVSVEPELGDDSLAPQVASTAGTDIGRIRVGGPVIASMLQGGHPAGTGTSVTPTDAGRPAPGAPGPGLAPGAALAVPAPAGEGPVPAGASEAEGTIHPAQPADGPSAEQAATDDGGEPAPVAPAEPAVAASVFELPEDELRALSGRLDDVLTSYSLPLQPVQPSEAVCGPNTVRFRIRMARGGTIGQVEARERDIMRELGLDKPIMVGQGAGFVTLDVPRSSPVTVMFGDLRSQLAHVGRSRGELPVLFGVDLSGRPRIEDLAQLPHLLVAGSTGSGKSVFLASLLGSLVMLPPDQVEIVLVDVKGLDFAPFSTLPHLRQPPIRDPEQALAVLNELYETERAQRHEILARAGAQSILDYYGRLGGTDLSQIVIVIDEFSNLLGGDKATGSQLEDTIQQYAEIMRSFGIYLVIATQRPSADIVTGRIKANLPSRCAFRLPTHSDSVTILGRKGAEQLLGKGDMLFYRDGFIERLQAPLTVAQDVLASTNSP